MTEQTTDLLQLIHQYKNGDEEALKEIKLAIWMSKCKYQKTEHSYKFHTDYLEDGELASVFSEVNNEGYKRLKEYTDLTEWQDLIKVHINKLYAYLFDNEVYKHKAYYEFLGKPKKVYFTFLRQQQNVKRYKEYFPEGFNFRNDDDYFGLEECSEQNGYSFVSVYYLHMLASDLYNNVQDAKDKYKKVQIEHKMWRSGINRILKIIINNIKDYTNIKAVVRYINVCLSGYVKQWHKEILCLYRKTNKETGKIYYLDNSKTKERYSTMDLMFGEFSSNSGYYNLIVNFSNKTRNKVFTKKQSELIGEIKRIIEDEQNKNSDLFLFTADNKPKLNKQFIADKLNKDRSTISRNIKDMWDRMEKKYFEKCGQEVGLKQHNVRKYKIRIYKMKKYTNLHLYHYNSVRC